MQTYILQLVNKHGVIVNFERFNCKRQSTCIKQYVNACKSAYGYLFIRDIKKSAVLALYSTDSDGSNEQLVWSIASDKFLEEYV